MARRRRGRPEYIDTRQPGKTVAIVGILCIMVAILCQLRITSRAVTARPAAITLPFYTHDGDCPTPETRSLVQRSQATNVSALQALERAGQCLYALASD